MSIQRAIVSPWFIKVFVECLNKIHAHLSMQYHDIHTLKYAHILLSFQSSAVEELLLLYSFRYYWTL